MKVRKFLIDVKANQRIEGGILKIELDNVQFIDNRTDTYHIARIYIPEITTEWQTIYIPLDELRNLSNEDRVGLLSQFAFILEAGLNPIEDASIYIDNVGFANLKAEE